jgi:hypothetical protein
MKTGTGILLIAVLASIISCIKDRPGLTSLIPNGDFENWTSSSRLTDWTTNSCPECMPPFETYIVQKDSLGYHGKYAARLIYNNVYPSFAENKFPLRFHPLALGGYFKCNIHGADTVSVKIWLFKNNTAVDSGTWLNIATFAEYRHIRISISQNSLEVDTALIRITGGHIYGDLKVNTVFWADYLYFE